MPTLRYVLVDVFADRSLEGNALAVFTDARNIPEGRLQPPRAGDELVRNDSSGISHPSAGPEMPATVTWAGVR